MFLSIEKVLEKISEDQPLMHCIIAFLRFWDKGVTVLLSYKLRYVKQKWH